MTSQYKSREAGRIRLHPTIFNSRWYYLVQLGKQIRYITDNYIKKNAIIEIVDFGCGEMPYRPVIQPNVKKYYGADLAGNPNADFIINEYGKINVNSEFTDAVISTQVLEHVPDPSTYLEECYRILKNDGTLILSTHGYWIYHPDPTDYWRWTCDGLKKIISEKGFEIEYFKGIIGRGAMGLQLFQDSFIFKFPKFVNFIFVPIMQFFISLFDKIMKQETKNRDACTFILVAKKRI